MKTILRGGSKGKSINRLNFPLFASHLKIFIVNFDKSPTFPRLDKSSRCEITSLSRAPNSNWPDWEGGAGGEGEVKNVNK